jgi:hypothetical protein
MTTADLALPADRFNLTERARFTCYDVEWVAYDDGSMIDVIAAYEFDAETDETDYSLWCHGTSAADAAIYHVAAVIMDRSFVSGAHGQIEA